MDPYEEAGTAGRAASAALDAGERLALEVVAAEAGVDAAFVRSRLAQLRALVPDLGGKLAGMRAADQMRLAMKAGDVARTLVRLKVCV